MNSGSSDGESSRQELCHRVEANGKSLVVARGVLAEWASSVGMPEEQRDDLVLATYEAMANAAEHGYGGRGGVIEVNAHREDDTVTVTVVDTGVWRPPPADNGIRGRGLRMIEALSQRSAVTSADTGTTVVMSWSISPTG